MLNSPPGLPQLRRRCKVLKRGRSCGHPTAPELNQLRSALIFQGVCTERGLAVIDMGLCHIPLPRLTVV